MNSLAQQLSRLIIDKEHDAFEHKPPVLPREEKGYYKSEIGWIEVTGLDGAITSIWFLEKEPPTPTKEPTALVTNCIDQLDEYFQGRRTTFDLTTFTRGTEFQKRVWQELEAIPYGETRFYSEVAKLIGRDRAVRAVGSANSRNQLSIVVPCHRVIGRDGSLTGYAGELWRKQWLLDHERKHSGKE